MSIMQRRVGHCRRQQVVPSSHLVPRLFHHAHPRHLYDNTSTRCYSSSSSSSSTARDQQPTTTAAAAAAAPPPSSPSSSVLLRPPNRSRRQQFQQQQRGLSAPAPRAASRVDVAKLLTGAIAGAPTLRDLAELAAANAARLDHIHVAALVTRAAALSAAAAPLLQQPQPQPHQGGFLDGGDEKGGFLDAGDDDGGVLSVGGGGGGTVGAPAASNLPSCSSSSSSSSDLAAVPELLCSLLAQRLRHTTPASLTACLWGLARLSGAGLSAPLARALAAVPASIPSSSNAAARGDDRRGSWPPPHAPPRKPLIVALGARVLTLATADAEGGDGGDSTAAAAAAMTGAQLATAAWALGRIGYRPAPSWLRAFQSAAARALAAGRCSQTDAALLLHGLATMRAAPLEASFLSAWEAAVLANGADAANDRDVGAMLWALGALGARPSDAWLRAVFGSTRPRLRAFSAQALSSVLYGLAALGAPPPDAWLTALLEAAEANLVPGAGTGGGDANSAPAAEEAAPVDEGDMSSSGGDSGGGAITPQAFATALASLAKLGAAGRLDPAWLAGMLRRSAPALGRFSALELSNTAWALAQLAGSAPPPDGWQRAFLTACCARLPEFTGHQLASVVWSLALLRSPALPPPPAEWLAAVLAALRPHLRRLAPNARNGLLWALSALGANPGPAWLGECLSACFEGGALAADSVAAANVLFCASAVDADAVADWLEAYVSTPDAASLSASASAQPALGDTFAKYGALAGALAALAATDGRRLRAGWVEFSGGADWPGSADPAAATGDLGAGLLAAGASPPGFDAMYGGGGGGRRAQKGRA